MSNFQPHSDGALFTPDEIRVLMAAEYDRAIRFKTPLAILHIAVDRLGYLHDLYGEESKHEILAAVNNLLRSKTRASDLLGYPFGSSIIAAVPHIDLKYAKLLCERLISGARGLTFDTDGRTLRITVSVGLCHSGMDFEGFDSMFSSAKKASDVALAAGGDRYQEYTPPQPIPAPVPVAPAAPLPPSAAIATDESLLAETLRRALAGEIPAEQAKALLTKVMGDLQGPPEEPQDDQRHELLERRVTKLGSMLEDTEARLRSLLQNGQAGDAGVSSIYRDVQGIDSGDGQIDQKRDLLKAIFSANLQLKSIQEEGSN